MAGKKPSAQRKTRPTARRGKFQTINGYWGDAFVAATSTTIDHSTNDNGYLVCMRRHFSGYRLHPSTSTAIGNLLGLGGRSAQIVGHGDTAIVVTGTGQTAPDPAKYIALGNQSRWKPELARLKGRIDSLRVIACYTGAEAGGANLLFEMAKECGASVTAPTGLTWCGPNGWWLDPGARWQVATPTHKPQPIPKDPEGRSFGEITMLVLFDGDRKRQLKAEDVDTVVYQRQAGHQPSAAAPIVLQGASAIDFLRLVNFAEPFEPGGVPGAIVSGTITLRFKRSERTWSFAVYGDSLLQDTGRPSVFYRTTEGFGEALQTLA
jgi:hypothetical protein